MFALSRLVPALIVLLSGCASIYEGKYDWSEGWRSAQVERLGDARSMVDERDMLCTKDILSAFGPDQQFAVVTYRSQRTTWKRVRPVSPESAVSIGDRVYVNSERCDQPIVRGGDRAAGAEPR